MTRISGPEAMAMERDPSIPAADLPTDTSRLRRVLFTGAPIKASELATAIGREGDGGRSLVSQTMSVMRTLGFEFEHGEADQPHGEKPVRLTNPAHEPTPEQWEKTRARGRASKVTPNGRSDEERAKDAERMRAKRARLKEEKGKAKGAAEPEPILFLNGHDPAVVARLPGLTDALFVTGVGLGDDGKILLMLKASDGTSWSMDVLGAQF